MGTPKKIVKSVRIVTLSDVPATFMLRPKVIRAIRQEVLGDLKHGLKRVPAGCQADYRQPNLFEQLLQKIRGKK